MCIPDNLKEFGEDKQCKYHIPSTVKPARGDFYPHALPGKGLHFIGFTIPGLGGAEMPHIEGQVRCALTERTVCDWLIPALAAQAQRAAVWGNQGYIHPAGAVRD